MIFSNFVICSSTILDYTIVNKKCLHKIEQMTIDEDRDFVLERITNRAVKESDHNAITLILNLKMQIKDEIKPKEKTTKQWIINDKSLQEFKHQTQNMQMKINEKQSINQIYSTWQKELNSIMKNCFKTRTNGIKKNNSCSREQNELRRKKKYLKKQLTTYIQEGNVMQADITKIRIKICQPENYKSKGKETENTAKKWY